MLENSSTPKKIEKLWENWNKYADDKNRQNESLKKTETFREINRRRCHDTCDGCHEMWKDVHEDVEIKED